MKAKSLVSTLLLAVIVVCSFGVHNANARGNKPYSIKNGMIHFDEPKREAGQSSMLGFKAEPIDTVAGCKGRHTTEKNTDNNLRCRIRQFFRGCILVCEVYRKNKNTVK